MSTGPSSVLLAGGGTAGHVSPLLALADCLRRSDPDVRITALGTETGLEQRLVPARGYPLRTIPKVAVPAPPHDRPGPAARPRCAVRSSRPVRPSTRPAPRSSSASAATSPRRPTSPPGAGASRSSSTSRTPGPGWPTGWAPGMTRLRRDDVRLARCCPTPPWSACRCAARSPSSTGPPARDEALAHFGLSDTRPTLLVTGGSLGAQRLNATFAGARRGAARRRRAGAARQRAGQGVRARAPTPSGAALRRRSRTSTGWTSRTPPPTWWSPGRRQHRLRADRRRAAGGLRPAADRQRRAAGQRRRRRRGPPSYVLLPSQVRLRSVPVSAGGCRGLTGMHPGRSPRWLSRAGPGCGSP